MSACDYCLSGCSDDEHSLDDEGYGPSRECFHIDQGDHSEDNHLGMPEEDDAPVPVSRVEIPRELAVVPVPVGGQDTQLEQLREMQTKLGEEAGRLVQLRQNIEQDWAGRARVSSGPGRLAPHRRQCQGGAAPGFQRGRSEPGCNSDATPNNTGAIHHRGATYPGRAQGPPGRRRCLKSRELRLPKARVPLGASRNVLLTHAGGLGPHRAHTGRDACSPGPPRQ
jgi:hypothetical protein